MSYNDEFIKGGIVGMLHAIVGHPLDTLKTLKQGEHTLIYRVNQQGIRENIKLRTFSSLYAGVRYPFFSNVFYNSGLFGIYNYFINNKYSEFTSGFLSGGIMSVPLNPFEYYKIQEQYKKNTNVLERLKKTDREKYKWGSHIFKNGTIGLQYTFFRRSFAGGFYFKTYEESRRYGLSSFLSGGLAGCSSWLFTYPIDTLKTRYQVNQNLTFRENLKLGKLWNGFSFCMFRTFLISGISFTVYELC